MKIGNNLNTITQLTKDEKEKTNAPVDYSVFQGEIKVTPIMFNPTQADLDKLGCTDIKLFNNHYTKVDSTTTKPYGLLSLLFKYSPATLLNNPNLAEIKYGMYSIAVSNDDLIEHKVSEDYDYYKVSVIDEYGNTMDMSFNIDPSTLTLENLRKELALNIANIHRRQIAKANNSEYQYLPADAKAEVANNIDLNNITDAQRNKLFKFDCESAIIQKQGYAAFFKLIINLTSWGVSRFKPLGFKIPFDKTEWNNITKGNVTKLNKDFNTLDFFKCKNEDGTFEKNMIWVLAYGKVTTKTLENGEVKQYLNQDYLSPSYLGIKNGFNATANDVAKPSKPYFDNSDLCDLPKGFTSYIELRDIAAKVFGYNYTSKFFDEGKALIKPQQGFALSVATLPVPVEEEDDVF